MRTFIDVQSVTITGDRGKVTLGVPVPWAPGSGVTLKRTRIKGGERMNVKIEKVDGNTFEFNLPEETATFQRPDFTKGPVVVKG